MRKFLILLLILCLSMSLAFSYTDEEIDAKFQGLEKKAGKSADIHGRAYIYYIDDQLGISNPQFDISRIYLDFKNDLDKNSSVRLTTDIARESYLITTTEADTRVHVYMKYAYWQLSNLSVPFVGINQIRFGMSATHWIDFMQKFWRFRYIEKTITDQRNMFPSSDLGIAAFGSIIPGIDYHATVMNGPGYKKAEDNGYKDVAITFKANPLSWGNKDKITAAVGLHLDDTGKPGQVSTTTVMAGWQFSQPANGILFAEYGAATDDEIAFSVGGDYEVIPNVSLFARMDNYDPNTQNSSDEKNLDIVGIEYNWGKNVKIAFDYQVGLTGGNEDVKTIAIHSRVKW